MNLLKAIGKTALSLLKWMTIISLIIGGIVGFIFAVQTPSIASIIGYGLMGLLLLCLFWLIVLSIVWETKENYEKYARKSTSPENSYKIDYNIVYERNKIVNGKTKEQAIENLYSKVLDGSEDLDSHYKIIKVREIK